MSESWQGWVVGGMVLGALIYLVIRFFLNPKGARGQVVESVPPSHQFMAKVIP